MSRKTFTGSYCLLVILLCCFIFPGVLYYIIARRETGTKQVIQQSVIVQHPIQTQPIQINQRFCKNCGAPITSKFCENCGTKVK